MSEGPHLPRPRIRFDRSGGFLKAVLEGGDGSFAAMRECWQRIAGEFARAPAAGVLVVDRLDGELLTPEQQQQLVEQVATSGLGRTRVAYVMRTHAPVAYVERAEILSRGLDVDARVFDTEAAAARWLRHGER